MAKADRRADKEEGEDEDIFGVAEASGSVTGKFNAGLKRGAFSRGANQARPPHPPTPPPALPPPATSSVRPARTT